MSVPAGTAEVAATGGQEPDYRFLLANERTFLAYVRTALALDAAALALHQFLDLAPPGRLVAGVLCAALALLVSGLSYSRWRANDRAIRAGAGLPRPRGLGALAAGLTSTSFAVALIIALA